MLRGRRWASNGCIGGLDRLLRQRGERLLKSSLQHCQPCLGSSLEPPSFEAVKIVRTELGYFTNNAARMDYPTFRAQGLPIGSGAVESAAKHVAQVRMKRSGMRWSDSGGQAMLALCAYLASKRPLPFTSASPLSNAA